MVQLAQHLFPITGQWWFKCLLIFSSQFSGLIPLEKDYGFCFFPLKLTLDVLVSPSGTSSLVPPLLSSAATGTHIPDWGKPGHILLHLSNGLSTAAKPATDSSWPGWRVFLNLARACQTDRHCVATYVPLWVSITPIAVQHILWVCTAAALGQVGTSSWGMKRWCIALAEMWKNVRCTQVKCG